MAHARHGMQGSTQVPEPAEKCRMFYNSDDSVLSFMVIMISASVKHKTFMYYKRYVSTTEMKDYKLSIRFHNE